MLKKNRFLACVLYSDISAEFCSGKNLIQGDRHPEGIARSRNASKSWQPHTCFCFRDCPMTMGSIQWLSEGAFIVMTRVWVLVSRHTPRGLTTMLCGCSQIHYWKPHTHKVNVILVKYIIWSDHCSKYQVAHPEFEHLVFTLLFTT